MIGFRFVSDWVRGWREYSGPITERLKFAHFGTKSELCSLFNVSYRNTLLHHMKIEQLILIRTNLSSFSTYMKLNELLLTTKNKIKTRKGKLAY